MDKIEKIKNDIVSLAVINGMTFKSSQDLLKLHLDELEQLARVDQMQKVHDKMGVVNK